MMNIHDIARRGLMEFANAEEKYAPVEYLESTGTQWIDTGVLWDSLEYKIGANGKVVQTTTSYALIGSSSTDPTNGLTAITSKTGIVSFQLGRGANNQYASFNITDEYHSFEFDLQNKISYIDGASTTLTYSTTLGSLGNNNFLLFAYYNTGSWTGRGSVRLKSAFIKRSDGVLVRDMVPMLRLRDSKPGLYDRVSKQFYTNKGTGEFLYGDFVLPVGYQKVEYIESNYDGLTTSLMSYISLPIVTGKYSRCDIDYMPTVAVSDIKADHYIGSNYGFAVAVRNYGTTPKWFSASSLSKDYEADKRVLVSQTLEGNTKKYWIDGAQAHTAEQSPIYAGNPLFIGALSATNANVQPVSVPCLKGKCYGVRHWSLRGALSGAFIPAVRLSDGKPGLYDACQSKCALTGTSFYINSGSGADFSFNWGIPDAGLQYYNPMTSKAASLAIGGPMTYDELLTADRFTTYQGIPCVDLSNMENPTTAIVSGQAMYSSSTISEIAGNKSITLCAWVNLKAWATNWKYVLELENHPSYGLGMYYTGKKMHLNAYGKGADATDDAMLDTWYFVCGTYDKDTKIGTLYINGTTTNTAPANPSYYSAGRVVIGSYGRTNQGTYSWCPGRIGPCRIYNRVLYPGEIAALANEYQPTT